MNEKELLDMVYISAIASIISSQTIQKIKQTLNCNCILNKIISVFISFGIGFCFALSFYTEEILNALWIGLFTLIGAESLYKTFKGYFELSSSSNNK